MIRMGMGEEYKRDFLRGSANFLQIVLQQWARRGDASVDQTDLFPEEDVGIDKPIHISAFAEGQSEGMSYGMNCVCNFQIFTS
jgi:hypothetical protein